MIASTVVINGVSISPQMLATVYARKHPADDGSWILTTKRGVTIATFASEAELDSWWHVFQIGQGRNPKRIVEGKMPKRSKRSRGKHLPTQEALGDYLKPWSGEYNMPEYDLE